MEDADLPALVAAAVASERGAWDELVRRFSSLVWAIARSYRLRQQDVEDVSQTVWLQLSTSLGQLRDPDALPGWLATTTRREAVRFARKVGRERPLEFSSGWTVLRTVRIPTLRRQRCGTSFGATYGPPSGSWGNGAGNC